MTRKDYVAFAGLLARLPETLALEGLEVDPIDIRETDDETTMLATRRWVAVHIADLFAADNNRFDRARFLKACGLEG